MACEAIGRCRICARKHKIAVFGGEQQQHSFIEKANLKLIILNTVCVACIGKIEYFVKTMDLDMMSRDCVKEDLEIRENVTQNINEKKIKTELESSSPSNIPYKSIPMDVDKPVRIEHDEKSIAKEIEPLDSFHNGCNDSSDVAKNNTQHLSFGDSQPAVQTPYYSTNQIIGQDSEPPRRKRPRYVTKSEILLAGEANQKNIEDVRISLPIQPHHAQTTIAFVDCGSASSPSPSGMKKIGRFLGCDFCGKEFTHAGDLNKHRRKHTGEKPYECNQCNRKFAHASNLARHQRVHSGERPFICPNCAKSFTRRDKLAIHITAARCHTNSANDNHIDCEISQKIVGKTQT